MHSSAYSRYSFADMIRFPVWRILPHNSAKWIWFLVNRTAGASRLGCLSRHMHSRRGAAAAGWLGWAQSPPFPQADNHAAGRIGKPAEIEIACVENPNVPGGTKVAIEGTLQETVRRRGGAAPCTASATSTLHRTQRSSRPLQRYRSDEIALADLDAAMAQNVVGGGEMEIIIG
jgi:hypothetical protein